MISYDELRSLFRDPVLFDQALTHRSYHNENLAISPGNNEKLEFLGDAVLDLVISEKLMADHLQCTEGDLSKIRASLVNESVLALLAREMDLGKKLKLGRGEKTTGGNDKPRILAGALEAIVGALFTENGYDGTKNVVIKMFEEKLASVDTTQHYAADFKSRLQEALQSAKKATPTYMLVSETGPDHDKIFVVEVVLGADVLARGDGKNKKQAEQSAAKIAFESLYVEEVVFIEGTIV
jgi:ribonuclease-3